MSARHPSFLFLNKLFLDNRRWESRKLVTPKPPSQVFVSGSPVRNSSDCRFSRDFPTSCCKRTLRKGVIKLGVNQQNNNSQVIKMINYFGHFSERMSHSLLFFLRVLLLFQTEMSTPTPLYIHYIYKFGLENNRQAQQFTVGFGKLWPFSQMTAAGMKRWENGAVGRTSRRCLNRIGWNSTPSETLLMNYNNITNPISLHVIWCLLHPPSFIQISSSFILPKYISGELGLYTYEKLIKDWRHVNILSRVESGYLT